LVLAERHRAAGNVDRARELIALAVDNHPGHAALLRAEESFDGTRIIDWREVLLGPRSPGHPPTEEAQPVP
jgi:hypothetical protein